MLENIQINVTVGHVGTDSIWTLKELCISSPSMYDIHLIKIKFAQTLPKIKKMKMKLVFLKDLNSIYAVCLQGDRPHFLTLTTPQGYKEMTQNDRTQS